jgi:hypothetical protein
VADDTRFDDYQMLVELMLAGGLTTAPLRPPPAVLGPPLTPEESIRADLGQKAAASGLELKALGWCDLGDGEARDVVARLNRPAAVADELKGACADGAFLDRAGLPRVLYRLQKPGAGANFIMCFQPADDLPALRESTCEAVQRRSARPGGSTELHLNLSHGAPRLCDALNRNRVHSQPLDCASELSLGFTFTVRSTYEIIRYLGEVVRRANYPDLGRTPRVISVKAEGPVGWIGASGSNDSGDARPICSAAVAPGEATPDNMACQPLFEVHRAASKETPFIKARYGWVDYAVTGSDAGRSDRRPTLDALQVVTELLALNRSAKDLPATSVFTVVAP